MSERERLNYQIEQSRAALAELDRLHLAALNAPHPPRAGKEVVIDLMRELCARAGNPPALMRLIDELELSPEA